MRVRLGNQKAKAAVSRFLVNRAQILRSRNSRRLVKSKRPCAIVHAVIDDFENYPSFMPYTVECRVVKHESDATYFYQRLSPKIVS